MIMIDVQRVLDEEGIRYQLDTLNPTYTVHLFDATCGMIDTSNEDGTQSWDCRVRHRNDRPQVEVNTAEELRAWLRQRFK